jgi:ferredoxin-thioredoxin reductase catalytic subunit
MEVNKNFEITDKLLSEIAGKISGGVGKICCRLTGGRGGRDADPVCDCRDTAKEILEYLQKETK